MTYWPGYPPPPPPKPPTPWYRNLMVWLWVYVGFAGIAIVGLAMLSVGGFFAFLFVAGDVEDGYDDADYYVEQESVNRAVAEPCDAMTTAADQIQIFSTPSVGAASLHHFADVGRGIPTAIDSVDDADGQALRWRNDWNVVLDAVDAYADELEADGAATFDTPLNGDDEPVLAVMAGVSDVGCEVPPIITALDPQFQLY